MKFPVKSIKLTSRIFAIISLLFILIGYQFIWIVVDRSGGPLWFDGSLTNKIWFGITTPNGETLHPSGQTIELSKLPKAVTELAVFRTASEESDWQNSDLYVNGVKYIGRMERNYGVLKSLPIDIFGKFKINFKFYPRIFLRRGINNFAFGKNAKQPSFYSNSTGILSVRYHPQKSLKPIFWGWTTEESSNEKQVIGFAEPNSKVFLQEDNQQIQYSYTNEIGAFIYSLKNPQTILLKVGLTPEDIQKKQANAIKISAAEATSQSLKSIDTKINITLSKDGKKILIDFRIKLPEQTVIHEWIEQRQITSIELASLLFSFGEFPIYDVFPSANIPRTETPVIKNGVITFRVTVNVPPKGVIDLGFNKNPLIPEIQNPLLRPKIQLQVPFINNAQINIVQPADNSTTAEDGITTYLWETVSQPTQDLREQPIIEISSNTETASSSINREDEAKNIENQSLFALLKKLQKQIPNIVKRIMFILFEATPFLWSLWIVRFGKNTINSNYKVQFSAALSTFLILHLANFVYSLSLLGYFYLYRTYSILAIGLTFLVVPIFNAYQGKNNIKITLKNIPVLVWISLGIFTLLASLRSVNYFLRKFTIAGYSLEDIRSWTLIAFIFFLLLSVIMYGLICSIVNRWMHFRDTTRATWLMLLIPLAPALLDSLARTSIFFLYDQQQHQSSYSGANIFLLLIPQTPGSILWLLITAWLGTVLLTSLIFTTTQLITSQLNYTLFDSRLAKTLLIVFCIILCFPAGTVLQTLNRSIANEFTFANLAEHITDLLPYSVLIGLIGLLYQLGLDPAFKLNRDTYRIGALLFAYYLTALTARTANVLFFLPLLLTGWYIFSKWVISPQPSISSVTSNYYPCKLLVRWLLDYKEANHFHSELRRNLSKQYITGQLKLTEWSDKIAESEQYEQRTKERLFKLRHEQNLTANKVKAMLFQSGPEPTPWENARIAVLYGVVLSLPFMFKTLLEILRHQNFGDYPLLGAANALLITVSSWLLTAFVFGYFFHDIRGKNGLEKGLVYATALIGPTILLTLLNDKVIFSPIYLSQVFQILTFVLILGLIGFDLRTLQKLGYGWREFLAIYGLAAISISIAPSLLAAVVSGVTGQQPIELLKQFIYLLLGIQNN